MLNRILRLSFSHSSSQSSSKKYILSQFPYPSGDLHLGHARVYYIGDSISTYYRLNNYKVIYPIGWDSFGLPAENAAMIHGRNPKQWTETNINKMKQQLQHLNVNFNWEMELSTSQPLYYKFTQQIFVRMFNKGLAYKKMAQVNWDPVDKTVLANEQVDENGCSWRSGAKVQRKQLSQWFLKITEYAEKLQVDLDKLQWIQKVKNMQRGWIGFKKGYKILVQLVKQQKTEKHLDRIEVFVEDIESLKSAKFIIKKLHQPQNQVLVSLQKDSIYGKSINPYNDQQLLVIHCPKEQSQNYKVVSQKEMKNNQHYRDVFNKYTNRSKNKDKGKEGKEVMKQKLESDNVARDNILKSAQQVQEIKLKDWLISRQRYWGCPIPIIYCKSCGTLPVPLQQLPVILPQWANKGNPLIQPEFKTCQCPKCGRNDAQRQSDTMDTFVDSSWYYLRFMDNLNQNQIFTKSNIEQMLPVDVYIGGIQHAIMHLLYARFVMRFIQKQYGLSEKCIEPFKQLVVQGLVKGRTLVLKENGKYISQRDVDEGKYSMDKVRVTYEKMSKSKFNGLNPNILVDKYGSDALRTAIFFANPPDRDIDFSEEIVVNAEKFLNRIQNLWKQLSLLNQTQLIQQNSESKQLLPKAQLLKLKNIFQKMQISIEKRLMHTYVANVMQMFNLIKDFVQLESIKINKINKVRLFAVFARVLPIIAPKIAKNLQQNILRKFSSIVNAREFDKWPSEQLFGEKIEVLVMKGKKMVAKDTLDLKLTDDQIVQALKLQGKVQQIKRQKKKFIVILKD